MSAPKISVIVPNYNHSKYLDQRIESILSQTYQDFEIILLDDFSTDDSLQVLNKYKDHPKVSNFIVNKVNSGSVFYQWNKGVFYAKGDFIWIAESDDIASPDFLENLIVKLLSDKKIGIAFCQSYKINSCGEIYGNWLNHTKEDEQNIFLNSFEMNGDVFIKRFMIEQNSIPNASGVVFRKCLFQSIDGAPINLKTIGDWSAYVKMLATSNVYFCHKELNYFRMHENSCVAISSKSDLRANIILMHFYMYDELCKFFWNRNAQISACFKKKKIVAASRFFLNCISNKNYKLLIDNFFQLRLFFLFFNVNFYIVLFRLILNLILNDAYAKI